MKTIRLRFSIYSIISILSFMSCLAIILKSQFGYSGKGILAGASLLLSIVFLCLACYEYRQLSFARLIIENMIIDIQSARTEQQSEGHSTTVISSDTMDIYISCFGILLGSKVIKFNTEGIQLREVGIGRDFIRIRFGKGNKEQFVQLLHKSLEENELVSIIEKFRRETGVIPNIISWAGSSKAGGVYYNK